MKKVLALILCALLTAGCLGGCGSSPTSAPAPVSGSGQTGGEPITLTMWHSFTQGPRKDFMDKAAADFEAQTGVKVVMETYPWADFYTKWTAGVATGQVPDISPALPAQVAEMIDIDALVPLNDLIDGMGRDQFYEAPINEFTVNGSNYGIPIYSHAHVLWYRKDLLEKAGITKVPETWEELYNAAVAVNDPPEVYGMPFSCGKGDFMATLFLNLYVKSAGETLLTPERRANLTSQAAIDGINYWVKVYKTVSPSDSINYKTTEHSTMYYQGKAAFDFNSGFHISGVEANAPELMDSIAAAPIPKVNAGDPKYGAVTSNIPVVVWKNSAHPAECKQFVEFLLQPERYVEFLHSVPVGMLPAMKGITDLPEFQNNETIQKFQQETEVISEALAIGSGIGMEYGCFPEASILTNQSVIEEMFQDIILNGTPTEQAAKAAEAKLNRLIETN